MNHKILLILLGITLVGGFLRFYKLDKYPLQLNHDEVSQIYDTASIVETGKDIYGNFLPLAFPSTGDFKVGHYIYISILPYLIFGLNDATIRIPSAGFGTLIIPAVFLFVNQLTRNWKLALLASVTIAITPSEIFYSRKSFENVIGVCFLFFGLYLLFRQLENIKSKTGLFLTPVFLALPMYIYTSHTLVVPLIVLVFALIFWKTISAYYKNYLLMLFFWGILILPLIYIMITNPGIRFRAESVSIFQDQNLVGQDILGYAFTKYLNQFNPPHIFANGLDLTNQGMIGLGPLMLMQLPFFFLGILYILRSPFFANNGKFLLVLPIIAVLPSGITFEAFSPHRSVFAFSIISIISAFGIFYTLNFLQKKSDIYKIGISLIIGLLFIFNFIYALHIYTVNFPYEKSQQMHYPYKDVAQFAWSKYSEFNQIIVDPIYGQSAPVRAVAVHYYLAYYGNVKPSRLQKDLKMEKTGINFDKFSVREINWKDDQFLKDTLIIASPWSIPISSIEKGKILRVFTFYDKQPAFYAIGL